MKLNQISRLLLLILGLAILSGCSVVGTMPTAMDTEVKQMTPPEGKALVYIVRPAVLGTAVPISVFCDGAKIGTTGGKRYIYAALDPGSHLFLSESENKSELAMVLEAGQTYFLEVKIKMGLIIARNELVRLDEIEGREKLAKCSLSSRLSTNLTQTSP